MIATRNFGFNQSYVFDFCLNHMKHPYFLQKLDAYSLLGRARFEGPFCSLLCHRIFQKRSLKMETLLQKHFLHETSWHSTFLLLPGSCRCWSSAAERRSRRFPSAWKSTRRRSTMRLRQSAASCKELARFLFFFGLKSATSERDEHIQALPESTLKPLKANRTFILSS